MAGGAIIVAQRARANQYTGRFTVFTFIAIITGATTGLVTLSAPHLPRRTPFSASILIFALQEVIEDVIDSDVLCAAFGLRQW